LLQLSQEPSRTLKFPKVLQENQLNQEHFKSFDSFQEVIKFLKDLLRALVFLKNNVRGFQEDSEPLKSFDFFQEVIKSLKDHLRALVFLKNNVRGFQGGWLKIRKEASTT
jgi:hypothetical protein